VNPQGSQPVAGRRSTAETPGNAPKNQPHPERVLAKCERHGAPPKISIITRNWDFAVNAGIPGGMHINILVRFRGSGDQVA